MSPAQVGRLCPSLLLPQNPNSLLFREPAVKVASLDVV